MAAGVRDAPWMKMSGSVSEDLGEELLKREVGDALRSLRLQNRAPYP
jgi:hypothetical protein